MIETIVAYKKIQEEIPAMIAKSKYKKMHFIKELAIPQSTFYRKAKTGKFTAEEMLKIFEIINPKAYYRWEYEQEIRRANKELINGKGVANEAATAFIRSKISR
jgi:predicted transcriptional regulator